MQTASVSLFCTILFFWTMLATLNIVYSVLYKYVWDDIAPKNYLRNVDPEHTDILLQENQV